MCSALEVHATLHVVGRFQSRKYIKMIDGVEFERTAFEVSVSQAELISSELSEEIPEEDISKSTDNALNLVETR